MSRRPSYTRHIPEILQALQQGYRETLDDLGRHTRRVPLPEILDTERVAQLLGVGHRQAIRLLSRVGVKTGKTIAITREGFGRYLVELYRQEGGDAVLRPYIEWLNRREDESRVAAPLPTTAPGLGEHVELGPGRATIHARSFAELATRLAAIIKVARQDPTFAHDVDEILSTGGTA